MENINMDNLLFIGTVSEKDGFTHWGTTNNKEKFLSFAQYLIDSVTHLDNFVIYEPKTKKTVSLEDFCTKVLGMHKRTFEERMGI